MNRLVLAAVFCTLFVLASAQDNTEEAAGSQELLDKRSPNAKWMRFGKRSPNAKWMRFGKRIPETKWMRFGKRSDALYDQMVDY